MVFDPHNDTPITENRPTVRDIARLAKVSTATVDRVLNGRVGVRAQTSRRVLDAAARLDYLPEDGAVGLSPVKQGNFVFLLPEGSNRFLNQLGETIRRSPDQFAPMNARCHVEFIQSFEPRVLAKALLHFGKRADGVAFMALEHPSVREAVNHLAEQGKPTVTFISDITNARRLAYIGLDNRSAGRLAGYLIARFIGDRPAKVAMIAGSLSYRAHEEREMGFLHVMQELFPKIAVVGLREGQDNTDKNYRQTRSLLSQHRDLAGIYNIGGAPEGVARALKELGHAHHVAFVGHGLTTETRSLLIDGIMDAVITQNPLETAIRCVSILARAQSGETTDQTYPLMRSDVIFRENLP